MPGTVGTRSARRQGFGLLVDDEGALVARVRNGDQRAFVELAERSRGPVWGVCLRITGNPHDAEDAMQDTLAAAWRYFDRFEGRSRFSTWLYRIALNAAVAIVKKRGIVAEHVGDPAAPQSAVSDRVADVERVREALLKLPLQRMEALVLREYGDFTYEEIARRQGTALDTVKSRIFRARKELAEILAASS